MKVPTILRTRTPIRLVEIAQLLGVTKQRAHQLAADPVSQRRGLHSITIGAGGPSQAGLAREHAGDVGPG